MPSDERPPSRVPTSPFRRGLRITRMGVMGTARAAAHAVNNAFRSDTDRAGRDDALWKAQAMMWVREVGQLKGSLMKAGQMVAMYGEQFLPKEATELLRSLQSDAPPVAFDSVKAVMDADLPAERMAQIVIDPKPCGTASLGQVHKAVLPDGSLVAMKVQYPGIKEALDADLKALRRLLSLMRVIARGETVDGLFAEVRTVLHDELDYVRERQMTDFFGEVLADDPRFVVPTTYAAYSSARVLTTRFEVGLDPEGPEVAALSQERRNALGLAFFELYLKELFVWHRVQTDPHFGNFRIRLGDGASSPDQIVVLDFGAVRDVSPTYLRTYRRLMLACLNDDRQAVLDMGLELGLLRPNDAPVAEQLFFDMARLIAEPFSSPNTPGRNHSLFDADGAYNFGESDLPRRVATKVTELGRAVGIRASPPESLFLDRKLAGVFLFLAQLKANVNGEKLLRRFTQAHRAELEPRATPN